MREFMKTSQEVLLELGTDPQSGLRKEQVSERRQRYGENVFTKRRGETALQRLLASFREPMILLLLLAACIALGVNLLRFFTGAETDFWECIGIFAAISLSVVITVVMEGKSAQAFEALSRINEDVLIKVLRDGQPALISQKEAVVGDILLVETGDRLPADGRLLESVSLQADESALTGESVPVAKDARFVASDEKTPVAEQGNMLFSGTFVTGGHGKMAVTQVGDQTQMGKIANELSGVKNTSTPLQEKLARLGKFITILGAGAAAIVFAMQVIIFVMGGTASLTTISDAFVTSIVLIVAAVPEGLPTIVAVSLSVNIIKMSRQNALVKKMIACETVGCISVICSDKTGTLTKNQMTVGKAYTQGRIVSPEEVKDEALLTNFCLNATADIRFDGGRLQFIGNPTECALLAAAHKAKADYHKRRASADIRHVYPFTSETKNMTTVVKDQDQFVAYTKGSPEKILSMCALSPEESGMIEKKITDFEAKACRVIAFAHKRAEREPEDWQTQRGELESGMHFDGFTAITDPLREEVYTAVARCREAGIDVKMLTGDNLVTACAIADELGILDGEHIAVQARDLEGLDDETFAKRLEKIRVIARSTPIIKMRVVNALKEAGHVVAVTGDGINDAPALKSADVGVAMGISGTEVAKEASDIVLLDDSFSTIVRAVQWGRGIYENFQRFIQFQLTVNLSSVLVVVASLLAGFPAPFTALQLLWINIIMDGPPALTLGLEPIRGDLMHRRPTRRDANVVNSKMLARIGWTGAFISILFMAQHFWNFLGASPEQESSVLFTLFVVCQLFNAFNCRELGDCSILKNFANNRLMLLVFAITFSLQIVIIQFGGAFFATTALPLALWLRIVLTALSVVFVSEAIRLVLRGRQRQRSATMYPAESKRS